MVSWAAGLSPMNQPLALAKSMTLLILVRTFFDVGVPSHGAKAWRTAAVSILDSGSLARSRVNSLRCALASRPFMPPTHAVACVSR
jgi:hypothetical protein